MKFITLYIIANCYLIALDLKGISNLKNWIILQEHPVKIEWRDFKGFPISRAEKVLEHNILLIANVIQDIGNYPVTFKRITKTKILEDNIVQIVLDMPFPFSGRDYIIKYNIEKNLDKWIFSFYSVEHNKGILDPRNVRLINAAGVWELIQISPNQTLVSYAWNGELLGNFPEFGLEKAWITQGTEVLNWLNESLSNGRKS
tara:strand:- start:2007 stop:2609 length:603 start_codon:yes stop_codon:yes gene_type:complete